MTAPPAARWPSTLWIVRHGQSSGNVAWDAADAAGLHLIDIAQRDADVPLSDLGREQARSLGRWFADMPLQDRPEVVLASPYLRARQTAELVEGAGGLGSRPVVLVDERLREREFGVLDRLTAAGIRARHPDLAEMRSSLGKFYFRPPGGESWCDVILRLRSALDTLSLHHAGRRVLIVAHQVVVLCLRYLLEGLTEEEILAIDRQADVANCAVTEFVATADAPGVMALRRYNFVAPLEREDTPVTDAADAKVAVR